ncbi:unnamed protein product [Adineta ricciae]|uniref:SWIM-type domain-containing protein n=1 Tax=Adineta ricciae TaxID=249248 RepID=A0A816F0J7_ADIRI|nr:unnamed protein product [Adineta ricciae]
MPDFLKGKKQLSSAEANHSRCVAKVRWIIESVNGKIKQWRYFSQTIQNSSTPFVGGYLNIICALINAYTKTSNIESDNQKQWATRMLELRDKENQLEQRLQQINQTKNRPQWKKYDAQMVNFPTLTEEDVQHICFGTYQIKQAKSYIEEHLKPSILDNEKYEFVVELSTKHVDLVRVRFASRHSSNKTYIATVQFDEDDYDEPIKGWFCTCAAGARIIGFCTHITALIWHLGVCRGETDSSDPQLSANNLLSNLEDCIQYSDNTSSSDDDDDSSETSSDDD